MRDILFRAKRDKNYCATQEWTYGVPFFDHEGDCIFKTASSERVVDPETVGQYTGLTDKNGTIIFEGDIVAGAVHWLERYKKGVVAFRDGSFGLIWYRGDVEQFNAFTSMCNVEYEVIGNIHDNPELLEGGAE
jgi:uncharacterized phage protein (TIGR01671 family)